jgi:hypothetical protein
VYPWSKGLNSLTENTEKQVPETMEENVQESQVKICFTSGEMMWFNNSC